MRRNLADLSLELGEEMANTESKLQYYKQLLASMSEKSTTNGSTEAQFNRLFDAMLANLADLSNKVQSFKQMLTKEYLSGLNFYVPVGQTVMRTDRLISLPKLGVLLLGIWVVFNVLMLAAAVSGLAVDWLAEGVIGLNMAAAIPVAFIKRGIVRLMFGEEILERGEHFSVRKNGFIKVSAAILICTALFLAVYIFTDSAGTRPFLFNLIRFACSLGCGYLMAFPVISLFNSEEKK